jgi:hypothetical protein
MGNYDTPGGTELITWQEIAGALVLVKPLSVEEGIPTVHGVTSAVRADVTVLDGPQAGREYADVPVFPRMLQAQLKTKVGKLVLGRLVQGQAKAGQTAPWQLDPATPQDEQVADAHLARKRTGQYQQPQQQPQQSFGQQPQPSSQAPF